MAILSWRIGLARTGAFESNSVHLDAMKAAGEASPENAKNPEKTVFSRGLKQEALAGFEPAMADLQSAALATWPQRPELEFCVAVNCPTSNR